MTACAAHAGGRPAATRECLLLDGWRFHRGAAPGAGAPGFDDSGWETLRIPHDWAIAGPFDKAIDRQVVAIAENLESAATEKTGRTGALPWIGEGWYRRVFEIPGGCGHAELVFDGAMANAEVYVDGVEVARRACGYVTFSACLDAFLGGGARRHVLAVRLRTEPQSSRWYAGAGLYRPVRLRLSGAAWLDPLATFARTTRLSADAARVEVSAALRRAVPGGAGGGARLVARLFAPGGRPVAEASSAFEQPEGGASLALDIAAPLPWTPETPALYTLRLEARGASGSLLDETALRIGLRTVEVTERGFELNGRVRKFRGVCLHHDFGPLGAAFSQDAFRRQARILKDLGCDAIRTAHNMPAPWLADLCDELGLMVVAESFDAWFTAKCENDYARHFRADWRKDLDDLVLRHRNHPSVVFWSLGNESHDLDTPEGVAVYGEMQARCRAMDATRPITQGIHVPDVAIASGILQATDVAGVQYRLPRLAEASRHARRGVVLGTETASTVSSRGVYKFPAVPAVGATHPDGQSSGYDIEWCPWGNPPDDDFAMQEDAPWAIGQFAWTGFDYLGEPSPYDEYWPSRSSYFGLLDLAGLPKDRYWLYRAQWNRASPTLHLVPHWTWPGREGLVTPVYCYTSYPAAELFLNGRSLGRRAKAPLSRFGRYRLRWEDAVYEPGELRVVAFDEAGRAAAERTVRTAGKPARLVLEADRAALPPLRDGETPPLAFATVGVVDADGILCPDASPTVSLSATGAVHFKAACNGDATSLESFAHPAMRAFHGRLVAVVEAGASCGAGLLVASAEGLGSASAAFAVAPQAAARPGGLGGT